MFTIQKGHMRGSGQWAMMRKRHWWWAGIRHWALLALLVAAIEPARITFAASQQDGSVLGTGMELGDSFGSAVAVSADGNLAFVGAESVNYGAGAVYAFTRHGTTWNMVGSGPIATGHAQGTGLGGAISTSNDGSTLLVGTRVGPGAAYVYVHRGDGWQLQGGGPLGVGVRSGDFFGSAVALSGDGNTALVAMASENPGGGEVYAYIRHGTRWARQGSGPISRNDGFSVAVALSGDGNTAVVGAAYHGPRDNGAVYTMVRMHGRWETLTRGAGAVGQPNDEFGQAVALSTDGATELIGADRAHGGIGVARVYMREGIGWRLKNEIVPGVGMRGLQYFGEVVALSGDARTALVGARGTHGKSGAAAIYVRHSAIWRLESTLALGSNQDDSYGIVSVTLSRDGVTALIGAPSRGTSGTVVAYARVGATWKRQARAASVQWILADGGPIRIGTPYDTVGDTVALSANGDIALIGASGVDNATGAAYVYGRHGATWHPLGSSVLAKGPVPGSRFGRFATLNGDGRTALIGAPRAYGNRGAAYIYVRRGVTWVQQGNGPIGEGLAPTAPLDFGLGGAMAISTDGSVALVGQENLRESAGGAFLYVRQGDRWSLVGGHALVRGSAAGTLMGSSLALSGDGAMAIVGAPGENSGAGAVLVYQSTGARWGQRDALLPPDAQAKQFGRSVAISADGSTVLVSAESPQGIGMIYAYTRQGKSWHRQGAGTGTSAYDGFGEAIALDARGTVALVGAHRASFGSGIVYALMRAKSTGTWLSQGTVAIGDTNNRGALGYAVALSADGRTALAGAPDRANESGAAYLYNRPK